MKKYEWVDGAFRIGNGLAKHTLRLYYLTNFCPEFIIHVRHEQFLIENKIILVEEKAK